MSEISQITLPSGDTYMIKDAAARASIPTKTSDLTNDNLFVNAEFSGTALVLNSTYEDVQHAEGVGF